MLFFKVFIGPMILFLACGMSHTDLRQSIDNKSDVSILAPLPGSYNLNALLPELQGKRVGLVVNQTSIIGHTHLVDTLLSQGITINKIFSPEHGYRGEADAGEHVLSEKDPATGILLVSLYGDRRKPLPEDLTGLDIVVFDIQDIGVRFYTYIATMSLLMEACAEQHLPLIVLDRPNPNGYYVDGPLLKKEFKSFIGMHPVPVVYGLSIGEYAQMVNGEGWLANNVKCELRVIPCNNYDHTMTYDLPVKPSPNIPNLRSTLLYPSICFFEGTNCSEGRGTEQPFVIFGHPKYTAGDFQFTPVPRPGAKSSKLYNQMCNGHNLTALSIEEIMSWRRINLYWLLKLYQNMKDRDDFFLKNNFFNKLAGNTELMAQIKAGMSEEEIRATWLSDITAYKKIRKKYLIYPDFE
ncbi:MAG: DUF1343 domain-containing protein [Saprospiraceae bacterium]|nr:DUF1343 domain-containing protein [Saprospiraceae bacterium]